MKSVAVIKNSMLKVKYPVVKMEHPDNVEDKIVSRQYLIFIKEVKLRNPSFIVEDIMVD